MADAGGDEAGVGFRRRESPAEIRPCLVALYLPQSFPGMGWHQQGFGGGGGGLGVGAALMTYIERAVPGRDFVLDAQMHALAFYERLGYVAEGDVFMDAGIPHRHMRKRLA